MPVSPGADTRDRPSECRKFLANALGIQPAGEGSRTGRREQRGCGAVPGGSEADGCSQFSKLGWRGQAPVSLRGPALDAGHPRDGVTLDEVALKPRTIP